MLGAIGGLKTITVLLEISVILAVLTWLWFKPFPEFTRRRVWIFGALWVLLVTAEFWILGPFSFIHNGDEGEYVIPGYMYLSRWHDGGRLAHGILGDTDAYTILIGGMTKITPGVLLLEYLPPWAAIGIHKILLSGTAFFGAYLLARRGGGAERETSAAIAASYVVAHLYLVTSTLTMGFLTFAVIPLAVYVFVFRLHKKHNFGSVFATSALVALGVTPTNSGIGLGFAMLVVWVFTGAHRVGRFSAAVSILLLAVFANWHEKLFAFLQMAPLSYRGTVRDLTPKFADILPESISFYKSMTPEAVPLIILALVILWLKRRERFWLSAGMVLIVMLSGPLLKIVPWKATPLDFLSGVRFQYVMFALPVLLILIAGWASSVEGIKLTFGRRKSPLLATLFIAVAIAQAASFKVFHLAQWVGFGGQSVYVNYKNLLNPSWAPDHLFRTVTIPYRLAPDIVVNYGLESFDGISNLLLANKGLYWEHTMLLSGKGVGAGYLNVTNHAAMDYLCCTSYDAIKILNFDALRAGNVEFVISALPLTGGGLRLVSGPKDNAIPPRRSDTMKEKIMGGVARVFRTTNAYVYKIPNPLPRAFVATEISTTLAQPSNKADYDFFVAQSLVRRAVVSPQDSQLIGVPSSPLPDGRVLSVSKTVNGYDVNVEMPKGGVLVINTPWTPFWRATGAGISLQVVQANAIHSAIKIPKGMTRVEFRYNRPMLRDYVQR